MTKICYVVMVKRNKITWMMMMNILYDFTMLNRFSFRWGKIAATPKKKKEKSK